MAVRRYPKHCRARRCAAAHPQSVRLPPAPPACPIPAGLYALNVVMALVSIAAAIGSCRNIITGWEGFSLV